MKEKPHRIILALVATFFAKMSMIFGLNLGQCSLYLFVSLKMQFFLQTYMTLEFTI
jgi:hypothetical protein